MALSNIFREPRREITESIVGSVAFGIIAWGDYSFAEWLQEWAGRRTYSDGSWNYNIPWEFGMVIGLVVAIAALGVVFLTHELGDAICNALQRGGIHLRPRQRR